MLLSYHKCVPIPAQMCPQPNTNVSLLQHKCITIPTQMYPYSKTNVSLSQHKCILIPNQTNTSLFQQKCVHSPTKCARIPKQMRLYSNTNMSLPQYKYVPIPSQIVSNPQKFYFKIKVPRNFSSGPRPHPRKVDVFNLEVIQKMLHVNKLIAHTCLSLVIQSCQQLLISLDL